MTSRQWEGSGIVVEGSSCSFSLWVTRKTGSITVCIPPNALVLVVGFRILVTTQTVELCIVGWIVVAFGTLHPLSVMTATVNREVKSIVVKRSWHPGIFIMTRGTVCRELCSHVIGVGSSHIIGVVTAITSVGCVAVSTAMAGSAIIGYCCVGSV